MNACQRGERALLLLTSLVCFCLLMPCYCLSGWSTQAAQPLPRYVDDQEDLEWDEVFNGAKMDDKTEVKGEWSEEAEAFLETLKITTPKQRMPMNGMPVSDMQQQNAHSLDQNSAGSRQGPAKTSRHSTESHSRHQTNGFASGSHQHLQTNGISHGSSSHPQSPDSSGASQDEDQPGPSQAIPPNKRRRTDAGTAPGLNAQARQHQGASAATTELRFSGKVS